MKTLHSISLDAFRNLMVHTMGFQQFIREPSNEVYWQASIPKTAVGIQVRSGMLGDGSFAPAPDIGIRIYIVDLTTGSSMMPMVRVRRTEHSLRNVRLQIGILWKQLTRK